MDWLVSMPSYEEVSFTITRDDGEEFIIDGSVWRIPSDGLEGWHTLQTDIASLDNVNHDGSVVTNQRVGSVDRTITAELRDAHNNHIMRRQAERFFLPKREFSVVARYMGRERKCNGVQAGFKLSEGNIYQPITLSWTIYCADPYMLATEPTYAVDAFSGVDKAGMPYLVSGSNTQVDDILINGGFITGLNESRDIGFWQPLKQWEQYEFLAMRSNSDMAALPRIEIGSSLGYTIGATTLLIQIGLVARRDYMEDVDPEYHKDIWITHNDNMSFRISIDEFLGKKLIIDFNKRPFYITYADGSRANVQLINNTYFYRNNIRKLEKPNLVFCVHIKEENAAVYAKPKLKDIKIESVGKYTGI